ncbi:MAG: response regulator [Betaproteobacteria bacterium]|nr:MAG: response regulator [Betaproteobacteria bacterium]
MKSPGIRTQLLVVALAPAIVVAAMLTAVFLHARIGDLSGAHQQRAQALARQLAANAEIGLFAGNRSALQMLANAAMREPDVAAVAIIDRDGTVLAQAGQSDIALPRDAAGSAVTQEIEKGLRHLVLQPVATSELSVDSLFEGSGSSKVRPPELLGHVALELSRANLAKLERALIIAGLLVTLGGLLFGGVLAVRLSRGVSRPLLALAQTVEQVGRGDLAARVAVDQAGPLQGLAEGVNRMASRIEQARDDLERRIAEATTELRRKKDEAEQANVAKSRFVATASHDLRQPMHALGLFVDSLRDEVGGQPRSRRLLEGMRNSIDAMTAMFDALLDISRLDAGVIVEQRVDFPVRTVLGHVEAMFTPLALERGVRFSVVGSSAWIRSDPALLERILQNLVSNAIKHANGGGVVVGCRHLPGALSIQVWDAGPGIAPEHQQDIFQEFFQLENPERDRSKGLGLGLAIVDRIARLLNHPVRLRSAPGRGSMFAVEVPCGEAGASAPEPAQLELIADHFAGACVAVIDDDQASVEAMTGLLEGWKCVVVGADSETSLLAQLDAHQRSPDLVISDFRLRSGRTGLMAVADIRKLLGRAVPAILVTGDTAPDRLLEAHASGLELLHKPVSPGKLRQLMRLLLLRRTTEPLPEGEGFAAPEGRR